MRHLLDVADVQALVRRGELLLVAGDEPLLRQLPPGRWIGGTIPYFMTEHGGVCDRRRIYVDRPGPGLRYLGVHRYAAHDVARVYLDLQPGRVGLMIAPSLSPVHRAFALDAPSFPHFAAAPLFGWIAGVHLDDLGRARARVFDGSSGQALEDDAVVMHAALEPGYAAELGILNIFEPGDGPALVFPETSFTVTRAEVGGRRVELVDWLAAAHVDTRLPLVADYCGARVNVSFQAVDPGRREVRFFAPVFAGVPYRHARPVGDYVRAFESALPVGLGDAVALSCNCVLNYVNCSLEGRSTGGIVGPITFGEIGYQLLNQTMVYLTLSRSR
jgi:hypothetical protein